MDGADTISVGEAAELLNVSRKTITNYATAGRFKGAYKERDRWRIPLSEVERVREELQQDHRRKPGKKQKEDTGTTGLIELLRGQVEDLRADRDAWREQARRSDYLLGGALERTRELEGRLREIEAPPLSEPSEVRESPVSPAPADTPTQHPAAPRAATQSPLRGLLRRVFNR